MLIYALCTLLLIEGHLRAEARYVTSSLLKRDSRSLKQAEDPAGVAPAAAPVPQAASDSAGRAPQGVRPPTPARGPSPGEQIGSSISDSGGAGSADSTSSAVAALDSASDTAQPPGADAVGVPPARESPPPLALTPPHPSINGTLPVPMPADDMPGTGPPPYSFANGVKTARKHQNASWIAAVVVVAVLLAAPAGCIFTCRRRRRRDAQQARFVALRADQEMAFKESDFDEGDDLR